MRTRASRLLLAAVSAVPVLALSACGGSSGGGAASGTTLRLGYFPNVTHATPVLGVSKGFFQKHLGANKLETQTFNAGPAAVEAIFAGSLDAAYVGPNPAINAFVKSKGEAIRIVSGATSGGASLVVKKGIHSAADLKGKTMATPQLGGTQDVALRSWLESKGLKTSTTKGGDVDIAAGTENATTLQLFQDGKLDGAWLPEPWASRLVLEGGGHVLVDEADLWPKGKFVTTNLIVTTSFLKAHPDTVQQLLEGALETTTWINGNEADAKTAINAALKDLTGKQLKPEVLDRAFKRITITLDPVAASLATAAEHAVDLKLTDKSDLTGIYDLTILNKVLTAAGKKAVSGAGLEGS